MVIWVVVVEKVGGGVIADRSRLLSRNCKPSSLLVARAVFLGAERRLGGIATTTGKRLSFYDQLVWISANPYIQVVVELWPRLKFGLQQTFEIDDICRRSYRLASATASLLSLPGRLPLNPCIDMISSLPPNSLRP